MSSYDIFLPLDSLLSLKIEKSCCFPFASTVERGSELNRTNDELSFDSVSFLPEQYSGVLMIYFTAVRFTDSKDITKICKGRIIAKGIAKYDFPIKW